jgi:hypothetical protein
MTLMTVTLAQVLWQSPALAPAAVGLLTALAAAVSVFYPPQTRGVPGLWRWSMPALRTMAVAALAVAVAQPMVLRPRTPARQGALVILADRSRSMGVIDRGRTPAELVALAAGLGAIPPEARPEAAAGVRGRLDEIRWLADQWARARSEAEYARVSGHGGAAAGARLAEATERLRAALAQLPDLPPAGELGGRIAELKRAFGPAGPAGDEAALRSLRGALDAARAALDRSQAQADEQLFRQNESIRKVCTELGSRTREQLLEAGLTQANGVLASLPAGTPVYEFAFADELEPLRAPRGVVGEMPHLDPAGWRSDIAGAVRGALNRTAARSLQAMIVLSDGRQVGGDAEGIASDLSVAGVPVFAVQTSAPGVRRDVAVVSVAAPDSARVGEVVGVRVDVRGPGFPGAALDVRLDAQETQQVRRVTIGESGTATARFEVTLSRPGPQAIVASVLPLEGESSDANNRLERWIKVGVEPARVLVIAGAEAGRQYAALHAALARCAWVSLREVEQDDVAARLGARAIDQQDVIVLVDVPPAALSEAQWSALERASRRRAASVIVCAGRHAPAEYAQHAWASRLLPYESSRTPSWRTWPAEAPQFRIVPVPEGSGSVAGSVEGPTAESQLWRQLPPVSRYFPLSPLVPDARALLVERESGAVVLSDARRGLGHVYFLGTDQSWRWRVPAAGGGGGEAGAADDAREEFWPQLIHVAAGEPYVTSSASATSSVTSSPQGGIWLDVSNLAPEPDEPFAVRARVHDVYGQPIESGTQTLRILRRDDRGPVREVTLASMGESSGRYEGGVSGLPAGAYILRLEPGEDSSPEAATEPAELPLTVAPKMGEEMADVSGDDRLLRRIAEASGGQFLTLAQFNALPNRLTENRQKQSRLVEYTLWDSPYLFGFVLACLSAEWALRKKFGLA